MEERETMLTERNAARNEVERLKAELSGFQKAAETRRTVVNAIFEPGDVEERRELKRKAEEALTEREVLIAERDAARSEAARLRTELKAYEDAAEARREVVAAIHLRDEM